MSIRAKLRKIFKKHRSAKLSKDLLAEKNAATAAKEPWVGIVHFDIDPDNLSEGSFELDWNDIFIARLIKYGYRGHNDQEMVDSWFRQISYSMFTDEFEQEIADPDKRRMIKKKLIENGRSENY
jgi:hypothetical protein